MEFVGTPPNEYRLERKTTRFGTGLFKVFKNGRPSIRVSNKLHNIPTTAPTSNEWGEHEWDEQRQTYTYVPNTSGTSFGNKQRKIEQEKNKKMKNEKEELRAEAQRIELEMPQHASIIKQRYSNLFSNLNRLHSSKRTGAINLEYVQKYQALQKNIATTRSRNAQQALLAQEKAILLAEKNALISEFPIHANEIKQKYSNLFSNLNKLHSQKISGQASPQFMEKYKQIVQMAIATRSSKPRGGNRLRSNKHRRRTHKMR